MQYLEEEVRRLRCKGEEDEGRNENGSRIDLRGDVVINGVEGAEEGLEPIDMYSTLVLKGGGVSEDDGEGSTTRPTRSCGTSTSSCSHKGLMFWDSASFYNCWSWPLGRAALGPTSSYSWPPVVWDASQWWTTTTWRCTTSTGRSYTQRIGW